MDSQGTAPPVSTGRYARKKEAIIAAAAGIMNRRGVKGMTLADVAASVDLITTSVTYYFKRKEDLAVACFLASIERFDTLISASLGAGPPEERLRRFLMLYLELNGRIRLGEEAPMAMFNDVRALKEPHLSRVTEPYVRLFRKVRELFLAAPGIDRKMATARTHVLMEQIFWSVAWLGRYDVEDYPRIGERMLDILAKGIAREGAAWVPAPVPGLAPPADSAREEFLTAATRLVNQCGYRGASVERISAELNVTKGSFYHHNEHKDDLVVACFERSFGIMKKVQSQAMKLPGDQWARLSAAAAALAQYQVSDKGPLLRTSAISALPEPIRQNMLAQWSRISDRFSAMISDGIAEGSLRAIDPVIAAQLLNATLNAAASLLNVVGGAARDEAASLYARPMLMGLFSR
ncbi:MAG TPA: TetR/AcrR family transcriptional regulator [Rhizomicrobium sp.]|nr:TetR/AcrR family transcriptional regulator [Rhizomicrobium sp.]